VAVKHIDRIHAGLEEQASVSRQRRSINIIGVDQFGRVEHLPAEIVEVAVGHEAADEERCLAGAEDQLVVALINVAIHVRSVDELSGDGVVVPGDACVDAINTGAVGGQGQTKIGVSWRVNRQVVAGHCSNMTC